MMVNSQKITKADLMELGSGTKNFMFQFKPNGMQKVSAKKLLIDDDDFSKPQDHYFSYINKV